LSPIRRSISAPETNIRFSNASRSPYRIHFYSRRLFDIKDFPVSPCRAVLSGALREKLRRGPPRRSFLLVGRQSPLGGAAVLELLESMASSARRGVMSEMGPKAPFSAFAEYFRSTSISRRSQSRSACLKGAKPGSRRSFDRLMRTSTLQKQSVATVCLSRRRECSTRPSLSRLCAWWVWCIAKETSHSAAAGVGSVGGGSR
jgi:hypothetical protein